MISYILQFLILFFQYRILVSLDSSLVLFASRFLVQWNYYRQKMKLLSFFFIMWKKNYADRPNQINWTDVRIVFEGRFYMMPSVFQPKLKQIYKFNFDEAKKLKSAQRAFSKLLVGLKGKVIHRHPIHSSLPWNGWKPYRQGCSIRLRKT